MRVVPILGVVCVAAALATPALAQDGSGWYPLDVPGGRATLRALGVADSSERSAVLIDLIRRLQFVTKPPFELEAALLKPPSRGDSGLILPMPLPPDRWSQISGRPMPASSLFFDILNDKAARLLFHGLAGMDQPTRKWMAGEPELLRALARDLDAAKSFAMFAPALRISNNQVVIPGGKPAVDRWTALLGTPPSDARRFISRVFSEREGRIAGLYFLLAYGEPNRRLFLLGDGQESFERLAATFASCYPRQSNDYPFVLRSPDPAILLLNLGLTDAGVLRGPRSRAFWRSVTNSGELTRTTLPPEGADIDAAELVGLMCSASAVDRGGVFASLLAGSRVFGDVEHGDADTLVALRVRQLFPALFAAVERAGIRDPGIYATLGRYAASLDRVMDVRETPIVLQQFQGAVSLILNASAAHTLDEAQTRRHLVTLTEVTLRGVRYNRGIALWLNGDLLPLFRQVTASPASSSVEQVVARALAGPLPVALQRLTWEGSEYFLDYPAANYLRLLAVRARQGGTTLDDALQLAAAAKDSAAVRAADRALGQALAAWTYTPHLGEPNLGALTGGDPSLRHDLGIRDVNRTHIAQRWQLALTAGDRGAIAGSYLGLDAALANWSLRRLSTDAIPAPPTLGDNDRSSMVSMIALADPSQFTDTAMHRIAVAIHEGDGLVEAARTDGEQLLSLGERALLSPWRREALPWMVANESDRVSEQFAPVARARLGGLRMDEAAAWGPSMLPLACLCIQRPPAYIPDLIVGRPIDGIVGAHSADLMFRVADLLDAMHMPALLAPAVSAYAMRDYLDVVRPAHPADTEAFSRAAMWLAPTMIEDYIGAIAAVGPLRPIDQ